MKGSVRPSRFFVVPGSKRTTPAPKSTCRHRSGSTSPTPPSRQVEEREHGAHVGLCRFQEGLKLLFLEEPCPHIVLGSRGNVGHRVEPSTLVGQPEGAPEAR